MQISYVHITKRAYITAVFRDTEAVQLVVNGDFNCRVGSRFYDTFLRFAGDNNLRLTDLHRLKYVFTFCNDAGNAFSWIDHFLCSHAVDSLVSDCSVHYQYVTSDRKPITVTYNHLLQHDNASASVTNDVVTNCKVLPDWSKCDHHHHHHFLY